MTYYPDLSPCTYFDRGRDCTSEWWASYLIAVGWLDPEETKPHCDVPPPDAIVDKLFQLVSHAWPRITFMGYHPCGFCPSPLPHSATQMSYKGRTYLLGDSNILVPGPGKVFVAPSLIVHYVIEHCYRLPNEFYSAVSSCPPPGSRAYAQAIRRNGPPAFRREFSSDWPS